MVRRSCSVCAVAVAYVVLLFVGHRASVLVEPSEASTECDVVEPYGDISGRVVFEGEIPDRRIVVQDGNPRVDGYCCSDDILSDELLVNPDDRGVRHAFVYLRPTISRERLPPSLREPAEAPVTVEVDGCRFLPHTAIVRTGQPIEVSSSDATPHIVRPRPVLNASQGGAIPFDFNTADPKPAGKLALKGYATRERVPFEVQCEHHDWMSAYWLVVDHPYAGVTDGHGRFTITGLPVGEHDFIVWHELTGFIHKQLRVTVKGGEVTDLDDISISQHGLKW